LQRNLEARRAQGKGFAADAEVGAQGGCYWNGEQVAATLTRKGCDDRMPDKERMFAVLQPTADPCHTLAKDNAAHAAVAFHPTQDPISSTDGSTHCMGTGSSRGDATIAVAQSMTVRRLTPRECERLQGFPDDWTMIPYRGKPPEECPDGPRYKALGNSMACNCMSWIGERIAAYEAQNGST
jgi:site-specific DNA-cytosine methylase